MKKGIIVFLIVLIVILITCLIIFIDDSRTVEKPIDEITRIATQKGGEDYAMFPLAYSLERTDSKITLTLYGNLETVKSIYEFSLENNVVTSVTRELHFEKKIYAKKYFANKDYKDLTNTKLKGNIVYGTSTENVGNDATTLIQELDNTYGSFLEKIK